MTYHIGIEAGGTKFACAAGAGPGDLEDVARIETVSPEVTLEQVRHYIRARIEHAGVPEAIGLASFGPIDIDRESANFGQLLKTPKLGWEGANIVDALGEFNIPIALDTDVTGAAIAEQKWGAGKGDRVVAYATVGTGIGVGIAIAGQSVTGNGHIEFGHIRPSRYMGDTFAGNCSFHGDCFEGLASGPVISERWGCELSQLGADHQAYALQMHYLCELCCAIFYAYAPEKFILGGGVMKTPGLLEKTVGAFKGRLNSYVGSQRKALEPEKFITAPALGDQAGVLGAIAIAQAELA